MENQLLELKRKLAEESALKRAKIEKGIRLFAQKAGAEVNSEDEMTFTVAFKGEEYPVIIGVEFSGIAMSYATFVRCLTKPTDAEGLLIHNRRGVKNSCFYFSLQTENAKAQIFLEARQFLDPRASVEDISQLLMTWRLEWLTATERG